MTTIAERREVLYSFFVGGKAHEYGFKFTTPSVLGITTFGILDHTSTTDSWLGNTPSLLGGKTYEVSVVDGLAVIGESL